MNRSIAKTRNQLQRITLKINQLKTKYTGDVYLHSNPTIETSPIASHTQTQFRQIQKQHERSRQTRDPIVSGFSNKQSQPTAKILSHNNSQAYCQPHCHNQSQASMGNEQLYQKQFKIFRNEIYNYIDRCIGGSRQRQEQIIQRMMEKYVQKQKTMTHQNNKSKNNMQERIKKIQQQTTNCITNIQDLLLQVKKNEKHMNEKILAQETKLKKQVQEMNSQVRKISGFDADRISITIEQLHMKVMGIDKIQKQLRQQTIKESKKLNSIDDIIQQINIKIENLQNRTNKKITESFNGQEQIMVNKFQTLSLEINKYHQFNVMLEKQILQLKARLQQNQLQAIQNQFDQSLFIKKMKQQFNPQFQQKITILEENIHKNLTDLASLAQTFLTMESRFSETSSTLVNLQQLIQASNQKIVAVSTEAEENKKLSQISLKQLITSNYEDLREKMRIQINEAQQKLNKNFTQLTSKIIHQQLHEEYREKNDIQQALFDKLSILINKHEAQIMSKILDKEQKIITVQQIQLMFNDLKNKLCEQIEAQISHTLALHEQNLIQKIKSQYTLSNIPGQPTLEFEQIEISIQNRMLLEIQIKLKNFKSEIEQKFQEKYKQIKRDKLNNIQCHHDDWSEQMSNEIENKVKKFIFDDQNSIKFHINKVEQKVQEFFNNFQASQRLGSNIKQNRIEDNQTQSIRRNDTLQSSQIGSQGQKNSPKLQELEQKKVIQLVEEKLTQFENDINETIKLLYQDIENKVNEMLNQSGIMQFRNHFQIFKSEISSLSTLVNSLILMNQTKTQQSNTKNVQNELLIIKNQLDKSRTQIYSEMSTQIEKISTILERACQEVELKVEKLDQNFTYMYQRLSNIEYDNANYKDKLSYFLSQKVRTPKIETKLIIEPKSENSENILDVLGMFSTGKKDFLES